MGRRAGFSVTVRIGLAYFFYKLAKITSQLINLVTVMLQNSRRLLYCVSRNKNTAEELAKAVTGQPKHSGEVLNFGQYTFTPSIGSLEQADPAQIHDQAQKIYKWAKDKKATHYSFLAYPHTGSICEKQEAFLNIKYVKNTVEAKPKELVEEAFTGKILIKGEGDGSSFPSGRLRITHTARGYTIWDPLSQLFIRRKKNLLYIPSLLVSHHGHALDDKTLFRQAEQILKRNTVELLNQLGIKTKSAVILLGLEQEFFAIEKASFDRREDLRFLGRAITGNVPPRNQQLGEHYYGKLPERVRVALLQVERELHEIGIPLKTKHNEVALNQFQICSICNDAGTAIDQNMITMEILKEVMEKHGLSALLHEKPFKDINGSGKHANWSLNYVKEDGTLKNLFATEANDSTRDFQLFKLFILMNLKAVQKNHKLYLTAIATPGNEIRLGGHQAPPRIISVFLGSALANLLDGKEQKVEKNLRELISYLNFDVKQENTDRNRTSPYAYTGNRFEFRALGSSQNPSYAMAVIAATVAQEIQAVIARLSKGESLESVIASLVEETRQIRFEGNGYSEEWKIQAKKRGLYVNEVFSEIYSFMENQQGVFERLNICSKEETVSRTNVVQQRYKETVNIQQKTLVLIADKHLLPRAYRHLHHIKGDFHSSVLDREFTSFKKSLEEAIEGVNKVRKVDLELSDSLSEYQNLRELVEEVSDVLTKLTAKLPHDGQCAFPDLYEFLRM